MIQLQLDSCEAKSQLSNRLWWVKRSAKGCFIYATNYLKHAESVAKTEIVLVGGKIISNAVVDLQRVVRNAMKPNGYHHPKGLVLLKIVIHEFCPLIIKPFFLGWDCIEWTCDQRAAFTRYIQSAHWLRMAFYLIYRGQRWMFSFASGETEEWLLLHHNWFVSVSEVHWSTTKKGNNCSLSTRSVFLCVFLYSFICKFEIKQVHVTRMILVFTRWIKINISLVSNKPVIV